MIDFPPFHREAKDFEATFRPQTTWGAQLWPQTLLYDMDTWTVGVTRDHRTQILINNKR